MAGVVNEEIFEGVAQGKVLDQINPNLVILGESSNLKLCIGQRGRAEIQVTTYGKNAYSANPDEGNNAVKNMFRLFHELENIHLPRDDFLGKAILELTDIHSYPYPGRSVIPDKCLATFDRRLLPGETEDQVIKPIHNEIKKLIQKDSFFMADAHIVEAQDQYYTGKTLSAKRFSLDGFLGREKHLSK